MALTAGTQLGPYEIQGPLGAGGMGEVYKARDTRLDRIVAIKVLPPQWADHAEMKQRFEREAHTIASLNHPRICVLHDIGRENSTDFLVMEYLEGETLAERLKRGPLGLDEALKVAIAIADGLDKAHREGVIHRDLKPSNVMLTESGPKLLDFGLARREASHAAGSGPISVTGATLSTPGAVLGTLQYMAPEQLEGLEADARTDIFALGVVLHEMVTGKRAFEGKSQVLLISAIATSEPPPLSQVEPASPAALDHVVKTCLAKDPADRWQTVRDLLAELRWIAEGGADTAVAAPVATTPPARTRVPHVVLAAAVILAGAMALPAFLYLRGPQAPSELRFRVPIQLTAEAAALGVNPVANGAFFNATSFAVSPDGHTLAFVARSNTSDPWLLFVRPIGSVAPQRLAGTEDAAQPFWSADSRSIAFVAGGKLKKVEATGGSPQDISDVSSFFGGTWNAEGTIVFGSAQGLWRVPAEGGKPETLTTVSSPETGHYWPSFLPDGRRYLYTAWSGQVSNRAIYAGTVGSTEKTRVLAAESNAAYSHSTSSGQANPGYLLFRRESTVYAQPFNAGTLALTGQPVRVADDVTYDGANGRGHFTVSPSGALAYFYNSGNATAASGGPQSDLADWQLTWASRSGQVIETIGPPGSYRGMEVSPDGKRVAVHRHDASGGDIVVIEPRGSVTRLTFDASRHNSMPIWSPDGTRIVYAALQKGKWGLYQTLSSGSGTEALLFESDLPKAPMSWSPDGKRLVFWVQDPKTSGDLWVLPMEGDHTPMPLVATPFSETHGQISPDGKWIAYTSNSTGGRNEIYVKPFPDGTGGWQVSTSGGDWPRWTHDGKELLYHSLGLAGAASVSVGPTTFPGPLFAAPVSASGATFEPGSPKEVVIILVVNLPHSGGDYHTYAISPDGQRILYNQFVPPATAAATGQLGPDPPSGLMVALNWSSALKK